MNKKTFLHEGRKRERPCQDKQPDLLPKDQFNRSCWRSFVRRWSGVDARTRREEGVREIAAMRRGGGRQADSCDCRPARGPN